MADDLQPCCQKARQTYLDRVVKTLTSYPLIKNIPCPTCRRIIPIRLYVPPDKAQDSA
jgi:hypothetical protein